MKKTKLSGLFMLFAVAVFFYPADEAIARDAWEKQESYECYVPGEGTTTGTYCGAGGGGCVKDFCDN